MATFKIDLTNLSVDAWFPPEEPLEEQLIRGATGVYTISTFGTSIGYYLQVNTGDRVNPLRLGQAVRARGVDSEGKPVSTVVLETTGTGSPATFKGPYHAAVAASGASPGAASLARLPSVIPAASRVVALGGGAQFWAYISPSNDTAHAVTQWEVILSQGSWSGRITSANPREDLRTPGLSGVFDVVVFASGPKMPRQRLQPQVGSSANIGCNSNCSAMVGIVANAEGTGANYWTVWDALCGG